MFSSKRGGLQKWLPDAITLAYNWE